jgi:hypothetical protein
VNDTETRFAQRAVRRRRLFMALAIAGVTVAAGLSGLYGWWWLHDHAFAIGPRMVIILLVLLNARQNLRQYRYAGVIAELLEKRAAPRPTD